MHTSYVQIGTHILFVSTKDDEVLLWLREQFKIVQPERWDDFLPDMYIRIASGYGSPVEDIEVRIRKERDRIYYKREDFLLETDDHYRRVLLNVHDDLALNHAIMTIYSAFIVHYQWGLMVHSSCIVEGDRAFLFAGQSGAGKSTVAMLSEPRKILSDEATLIKLEPMGAFVFDSPFRSETKPSFDPDPLPLAGIHLLQQSPTIERKQIKSSEAVFRLMDKIFYWAVDPAETIKLLTMCGKLAELVPAFELLFQKNDLFWERIS